MLGGHPKPSAAPWGGRPWSLALSALGPVGEAAPPGLGRLLEEPDATCREPGDQAPPWDRWPLQPRPQGQVPCRRWSMGDQKGGAGPRPPRPWDLICTLMQLLGGGCVHASPAVPGAGDPQGVRTLGAAQDPTLHLPQRTGQLCGGQAKMPTAEKRKKGLPNDCAQGNNPVFEFVCDDLCVDKGTHTRLLAFCWRREGRPP